MKVEQILALVDAGFTKDDILGLLDKAHEVKPAEQPAPADKKPEPQADPAQAAQTPAADPDPNSEIAFLRKQVQDLQKINLLYASGKGPEQKEESIEDIMTALLNGRAPAGK